MPTMKINAWAGLKTCQTLEQKRKSKAKQIMHRNPTYETWKRVWHLNECYNMTHDSDWNGWGDLPLHKSIGNKTSQTVDTHKRGGWSRSGVTSFLNFPWGLRGWHLYVQHLSQPTTQPKKKTPLVHPWPRETCATPGVELAPRPWMTRHMTLIEHTETNTDWRDISTLTNILKKKKYMTDVCIKNLQWYDMLQ